MDAASEPNEDRGARRVLAGIDEAGLGPMLGPLTIGYSAFEVPADVKNLWRHLGPVVGKNPSQDGKRIVVADSKQVFTRNPRGEKRLETTALAFLALLRAGRKPSMPPRELLFADLHPDMDLVARHPWYERLPASLPRHVDAGALELRTELLWKRMVARQVQLLAAGVRVVPAGELNASYRETDNKASTVWAKTEAVMRLIWERFAERDLALVVDQQGGRSHYAAPLMRSFPEAQVKEVGRAARFSEYTVTAPARTSGGPRRHMRILFAEKAETGSFPVALASCLAKYARELSMGAFNAHFAALQPGLKPTAGYRGDGSRWMEEAGQALERADLPADVLVRER